MAEQCDHVITYPAPGTEQIKFFMVADRLMKNHGDFPDYEEYYQELDQHLAKGLVEAEKQADEFGRSFAENIVMMRCTISSVREINGVLFILTLCVTGKNKAGCVLNQSTPLNFFTGRWKSLMKQPL